MNSTMQTLGKYRIVRQLGRGGFGAIYLAEDTSLDNRPVALKVLHPQLLVDPDTIQLFGREAGVGAKLDHRHIVTVHEAGDVGGTRFIAMQYVPGRSLSEVIKEEGPQPLERVAKWLEQVASALDYAHGEGVLHRDIKPSNILLDREGRAMLTDFGLAKALEHSGGSVSSRDKEIMTGTAKYMAPEQAKGKPVPQSDIYSLGVVLYELLTAKVPFEGDDPFAIAIRHMTEEPVSPREHRPDLPEPVEAAVLKALAKQPPARFVTAGEMAGAFRLAVEAEARAGEQAAQREEARELEAERRQHEKELAEAKRRAEQAEAARRREEAEAQRRRREPVQRWIWGVVGVAAIILASIGVVWSIRGSSTVPTKIVQATVAPTTAQSPVLVFVPTATSSPISTPTSPPTTMPTATPTATATLMMEELVPTGTRTYRSQPTNPSSLTVEETAIPRGATIRIWRVGSPYEVGKPPASIPPRLSQAIDKLGLSAEVESFTASEFLDQFSIARADGAIPDVLAGNNFGPFGDLIEADAQIANRLQNVWDSLDALADFVLLIRDSANHQAATQLALREPECDPLLAETTTPSDDELVELKRMAVILASAYIEGDLSTIQHYSDDSRLVTGSALENPGSVLESRICAIWGNQRLAFVSLVESFQAPETLGHMSVLLVLRKRDAVWQLLTMTWDPVSLRALNDSVPRLAGLLNIDSHTTAQPRPAVLLSPEDGHDLPIGRPFRDFVWQPSASSNVVAEIAEFEYGEATRLAFSFRSEQDVTRDSVSSGQLWTTLGTWHWRIWSISEEGMIGFSEARSFKH